MAAPLRPARAPRNFANMLAVFGVSVVIFLLPSLLDGGALLAPAPSRLTTPFPRAGAALPDFGAFAVDALPDSLMGDFLPDVMAYDGAQEAQPAHPSAEREPLAGQPRFGRPPGPAADDDVKPPAAADVPPGESNWLSWANPLAAAGGGTPTAAVAAAGDEIDTIIDSLDMTAPVQPLNNAENPDVVDRNLGMDALLKGLGGGDGNDGGGELDPAGLGTDVGEDLGVIPGDDATTTTTTAASGGGGGGKSHGVAATHARPAPLKSLPSTAGVQREGLARLYAPPEPPPPLATQRVSGYDWPASNITAHLDALEPPPEGMDAQVWRDFRPWRGRGFTMAELVRTRARKTPLLTEKTEYSHEIFTTVVKDGVPYYLVGEMKQLSHYKVARLLKLLDFVLQLHSVGKQYTLPDVYLVWTVLPNPLLHARNARDLVAAPAGEG